MAGPIARKYKSGSIIYFEGDKGDEIFILKSGRIVLTSVSLETGDEISEDLKPGEFFGVKSSLGHYLREETAQTLSDSIVLVMRLNEFEQIMGSNIRLVLKMLRVFSNQLRNLGKSVRNILGDTELKIPATELLKLAEYYFQSGKTDYAKYAYTKYLELFPTAKFKERAKEMLQLLGQSQSFPGKYTRLDEEDYTESTLADIPISTRVQSSAPALLAAKASEPIKTSTSMDFPEMENDQGLADNGFDEEPPMKEKANLGKQEFGGDFQLESSEIDFPEVNLEK
jgi:CRP-like cAMP-binding protein